MNAPGAAACPPDLLEAFTAYEAAIVANDVDALDGWFAPGSATMRGDGNGLLVGHAAISDFRNIRGGVGARDIERLEYRKLGVDVALLVSVSRFEAGGTGLQTQVWKRLTEGWRIIAAHVTPRPRAFDRTVWRVVGDPLVEPTCEPETSEPATCEPADAPLAGLGAAVKDLFAIEGHRIGAGNPAYLASAPVEAESAPAVVQLLRGGAAVVGIARTDEFAYSIAGVNAHVGTPPNGAVPGAIPGGSSSGPASAVATGQAHVGLATDTAGSIRVPASYQGLWGLRTTHGLVPRDGLLPLAPSFDTVGWLTRDGDTLQRVVDWCLGDVAGVQAELDTTIPARIVAPQALVDCADSATRDAFAAWSELAGIPASSAEGIDGEALARGADAFRVVQGAEAWRQHGAWLDANPGAVDDAIAARFAAGAAVTRAEEDEARETLAILAQRLRALVAERVLCFPTAPGGAPMRTAGADEIDRTRASTLRMTTPAAIAGLPAVSVPLLRVPTPHRGTAPVGVCLVSAPGTDAALVRLARRLAAAHHLPPNPTTEELS